MDGVTGEIRQYGEMIDQIQRWGAVVQSRHRGNGAPPTVALYMYNCVDYPAIFLGTMAVGAIATPLNPTYTPGVLLLVGTAVAV